jgi:hypothetical protein
MYYTSVMLSWLEIWWLKLCVRCVRFERYHPHAMSLTVHQLGTETPLDNPLTDHLYGGASMLMCLLGWQ